MRSGRPLRLMAAVALATALPLVVGAAGRLGPAGPASAYPAAPATGVAAAQDLAARPRPSPTDLLVTLTVGPRPVWVGGDNITVTVTIRNVFSFSVVDVNLVTAMPGVLLPPTLIEHSACTKEPVPGTCKFGSLSASQEVTARFTLPARAAVDGTVTATVSWNFVIIDGAPTDQPAEAVPLEGRTYAADSPVTLTAPITVLQPQVFLEPGIGPPGFVTFARGAGFPPGTTVRPSWTVGITAGPPSVAVAADGTFRVPMLIMPKDALGPRAVRVDHLTGTRFGPVAAPFLVVPDSQQPPEFNGRG